MIGPRSHALILHLLDYARVDHALPPWLTTPQAWAPLAVRLARLLRRLQTCPILRATTAALRQDLPRRCPLAIGTLVDWACAELSQQLHARVRPTQHRRERIIHRKIALHLLPGARVALAQAVLMAL